MLYREGNVTVLPGLGAQVEGYVLLVPDEHVFSVAELPEESVRGFDAVRRKVSHVLNQAYGPCVFFEHGACSATQKAGGCIDHAHVHALPLDKPLLQEASKMTRFNPLASLSDLQSWAGRPYVAIYDHEGVLHVADGEGLPGQYLRRIAGHVLGRPSEWDYAAYPHFERINSTIAHLAPLFEGIADELEDDAELADEGLLKRPVVYLARAVDNLEARDVNDTGDAWRRILRENGLTPIDPVVHPFPQVHAVRVDQSRPPAERVESDLQWLRRSDALLIDMSREDWTYVGCVCELVYAHLWRIPVVIVVGRSGLQKRIWLQYHATEIVENPEEAMAVLKRLFVGQLSVSKHAGQP